MGRSHMAEPHANSTQKSCNCEIHNRHCKASDFAYRHGETVLLRERKDYLLRLGGSLLTRLSYRVSIARGEREVIEHCFNPARKIDLLILDTFIPESGSEDLQKKIQACQPCAKDIFYSTGDWEVEPSCRRPGALIPVMSKPFSIRDLSRIIDLTLH